MTSRQLDERAIFGIARKLDSPEARAEYLQQVCGDDHAFRDRVLALLKGFEESASFLESPARDFAATLDHTPLEQPGTQIGPYKLLEQIGEGGMGVVYHASQREPVRRTVALKIIKPGMDSREVVARFEAERQALAMMDHPNIAKVFDGGTTGRGRPYFAMELVKGTPITAYCDRAQLSTRQRLELFVDLCHGVQHAHQKGVIHRDLKPSNVLIEVHDVRPVPKIIDFGIAKAMGQQLSEQSLHTAFDQMVGTPLYMSPEQAGHSSMDVDTRSDIYSLGVVLYELLTGHTPFDRDALRKSGVDEMRRIIREVDPPRPSTRVSTLQAADLSTISERRHVEPGKLSQQLRGELDWIVMKALDKDRDRRYATANDLAADVERYLRDEPVQACPPSTTYRFTKFARRNRTALVTSGLVALALIAGTGVSIWQAQIATNAKQQTAQALGTAEKRLQFGRQAVDEMYTQVAEKWLAQHAELTSVQKQFLEKALAFYQQLATEESTDPTVLFETAKAEQRVGELQNKLGKYAEAETAYRRAIELFGQLARTAQDAAQYNQGLAKTHRSLGSQLYSTGQLPEAEQQQRLAVTLCQALATQFPENSQYQVDLAKSHDGLGQVLAGMGQKDQARDAYRQSIALLESLVKSSPADHDLKYYLVGTQTNFAEKVVARASVAEAENIYRGAASRAAELVADDPTNPEYRVLQGDVLFKQGWNLQFLGRVSEAEAVLRQAVTINEGLVRDFPQVPMHREQLAGALSALAMVLRNLAKLDEWEQVQRQSLTMLEKLSAEFPKLPKYRSRIGGDLNNLAIGLMDCGKWEEARQCVELAIPHQKAALEMDPIQKFYQERLSAHQSLLTEVQLGLGDETAAALAAEALAQHFLVRSKTAVDTMKNLESCLTERAREELAEASRPTDLNLKKVHEVSTAARELETKAIVQAAAQQFENDWSQVCLACFLTTAPEPMRDADLALKMARRAVELKPEDNLCLQTLSWALYRTGDFQGAIEFDKKAGTKDSFIQAMAHWQLGEKPEARTSFDGACVELQRYEKECQAAEQQGQTSVPLTAQYQRLQTEAATLLGVTIPGAETSPEPAAKVEEAKEQPPSTPTSKTPNTEEPTK